MRSVTTFLLESSWDRDVSCGRQHDSVKELNMRFELISIGITLPVEINHDSCFLDIWDKLFMLLDKGIKKIMLLLSLILGSLSHQDFKDLGKPFLDFCPLKVFTKRIESISFSLELGRCVDLVCHDP